MIQAGIIAIALLLIMIFLNIPVAFALIITGFGGLIAVLGLEAALSSMAVIPFEQTNSYDLSVLPLFLLMGEFVSKGNIAKEAYMMARSWFGQIQGGLAVATTAACALFAAVCGSSTASAVAMGQITYPEMKRYNYDDKLTTAVIAAGGSMGILIPPSSAFIIIGILTQLSIGKLFIAGIIPGITQAVFYIVTIIILCKINPKLGPASAKTTLKEKFGSVKEPWPIVLLFLLVIGGIYGGIFTPTEAGAVGAFGALVIGLARRQLKGQSLAECLLDAAKMSAMIMALIVGSFIFNKFLALTRIPPMMGNYIATLGLSKIAVVVVILVIYLIMGCFFDAYAIIILTTPIFFPMIMALNLNPIWYGVLMVRTMEIGMITPPFGMNVFVLSGTVNIPVGTIYRGIVPFIIADLSNLALLTAIPFISTFLPDMMMSPSA